jgi:hypothetical protein
MTNFEGGAVGAGGGVIAGAFAVGPADAAGLASTTAAEVAERAGGLGADDTCCLARIAFNTSPGFEI